MSTKLDELAGMLRMTQQRLAEVQQRRMSLEADLTLERSAEGVLEQLAKRGSAQLESLLIAGLGAIYGPRYKFRRDGRNLMVDNGVVEVELSERGGGVTDVLALLLRVLALKQGHGGRIRTLILDEPLKSVDVETARRSSRFLRMLAERLGINVLMVTHRPELAEDATEVYRVTQEKGSTKVDLLEDRRET